MKHDSKLKALQRKIGPEVKLPLVLYPVSVDEPDTFKDAAGNPVTQEMIDAYDGPLILRVRIAKSRARSTETPTTLDAELTV